MLLYVGVPLLLFGVLMMARGWIYTFRPDGKMAQKRKRRNLKVGFTTDMALFGKKVRRLGLLVALAGGAAVGWSLTERVDAAAAIASVDAGVTQPPP
ncbi:MAG: hypothetical protein HYS27_18325 [Deltaproteobacteria bacterium]|nr:hypothetical protein [Deltaproteobacteria bacterium]